MSTDNAIIKQSLTDPNAFGAVFLKHAPNIHRYAARRVGAAIADDVLSETFLIAFEKRSKYDFSYTDARPWLLGIATKLIHRQRVAEAKLLNAIERNAVAERLHEDSASSAERFDESLEKSRLANALRHLKKGDRDAELRSALLGALALVPGVYSSEPFTTPLGHEVVAFSYAEPTRGGDQESYLISLDQGMLRGTIFESGGEAYQSYSTFKVADAISQTPTDEDLNPLR